MKTMGNLLGQGPTGLKPARGGRVWSFLAPGVAWVAGVVAWVSCSTAGPWGMTPPVVEGAAFVGNRACAECHTNYSRVFDSSAHGRLRFEGATTPEPTGCESCHGPGSRHVAVGGGRGQFIVNPGRKPEVCFGCHVETQAEFNLPQRHPVLEGKMTCVQCHDPHGWDIMKPARGPALARVNEQCSTCHREQSRPFVFEHEALRDGCTTCHVPHGSVHAMMLTERDNHLCLKCHAQTPGAGVSPGQVFIGTVDHTDRLRAGSCWSAGCHTAVHGSNVSPRHLY